MPLRLAVAVAALAAVACQLATVPPRPAAAPVLSDVVVQSGLAVPWDLAFAPDGRMFVTERPGDVIVFQSGAPYAPRLGRYAVPDVRAQGEAGLMGIALDPAFASNGLLYVCASRADEGEWRNEVLRLRAAGNTIAFDGYVVRRGMLAAGIHNGCALRFGPDGKLWISMGEHGTGALAQDTSSLNGKILRLNADGSIPPDDPVLPGRTSPNGVWTYGHRNPQGIAFQPGTGTVFVVEHGPDTDDEINVLEKGRNYGWPLATGPDPQHRFVDPAWSSGRATIANSGGTFVTGAAWGTWSGSLFTSQLKEADLRRYVVDGTRVTPAEILLDGKYGRLRACVLAPDGALYVTTSNGSGDRIVRIEAAQP